MFDLLRTPMNRTCVLLLPSVGKGNDTHHTGHIDGVLAPFIERTDFVPLLVFVLCRRLGFFAGSDLRRRRGPNNGKECNQTPGVDRMTGPFTNGALVRLVGNHYCCTQPSVQGNHASNVQEVSPCFVHGAVRLLVVFGFLIVVVNTHDVACMYMLYAESAELLYASILFATVGSVRIRNLLLGIEMLDWLVADGGGELFFLDLFDRFDQCEPARNRNAGGSFLCDRKSSHDFGTRFVHLTHRQQQPFIFRRYRLVSSPSTIIISFPALLIQEITSAWKREVICHQQQREKWFWDALWTCLGANPSCHPAPRNCRSIFPSSRKDARK